MIAVDIIDLECTPEVILLGEELPFQVLGSGGVYGFMDVRKFSCTWFSWIAAK
jgi:hypothetical protein